MNDLPIFNPVVQKVDFPVLNQIPQVCRRVSRETGVAGQQGRVGRAPGLRLWRRWGLEDSWNLDDPLTGYVSEGWKIDPPDNMISPA